VSLLVAIGVNGEGYSGAQEPQDLILLLGRQRLCQPVQDQSFPKPCVRCAASAFPKQVPGPHCFGASVEDSDEPGEKDC
jgi:hypothetical protein